MSKKIIGEIRLQLPAGAANPAPPVGPVGVYGLTSWDSKEFNAKTKDQAGMILPTVIMYADRSFSFIPVASCSITCSRYRQRLWCPNKDKVGTVTRKQVLEIVELSARI